MNYDLSLQGFLNLEGFLPLFIFSYAEIHYHLKFLFPKYFLKEPEIIADVPIRIIKSISHKLPVLIIIKDSHLFPVKLFLVEVTITGRKNKLTKKFSFDIELSKKYYSKILEVDVSGFDTEQFLQVSVEIKYEINGKKKTIVNDNYPGILKKPFKCFFAENKLPLPDFWFAGEPHYHSNYTSDQVEFGADIASTVKLAKNMGLSWLFITDHSYDLDDSENSYIKNDPDLPKWKAMKNDVQQLDSNEFRVIAGEEVSIGNSKGKNVHLLAIDHNEFIEGWGDSAEIWFKNKPQRSLKEIKELITLKDNSLFIAAHPAEKIPFLQKLTLRRGYWSIKDYQNSGIRFLQIINNNNLPEIQQAIEYWKSLLLDGYRFFILAGNDAHGNFNVMRQIKIPFLKLFASQKQVFGKFFTLFHYNENNPTEGLRSGKIVVSNGPFINFFLLNGTKKFHVGMTVTYRKIKIVYETRTSNEFGKIINADLFIGDIELKKEKKITNIKNNSEIELPLKGYVRMSMTTENNGLVFTNPVWVE